MHTGVWIMLYPWGKWPEQPADWELYHKLREDVQNNISSIPIQNANQGLYPNCGTSRDYGYGVMGYPTFTFETDDEQFVPGSFENLNERLGEEMDVMRFLINEVWYNRARLDIQSLSTDGDSIDLSVDNLGRASTTNATLQYLDANGMMVWNSSTFGVNATNSTTLSLDAANLSMMDGGTFALNYQVRVIESSRWVNEPLEGVEITIEESEETSFLIGYGLFNPLSLMACFIAVAAVANERKETDEEA
jgi:hypothetical protein